MEDKTICVRLKQRFWYKSAIYVLFIFKDMVSPKTFDRMLRAVTTNGLFVSA